MRNAKFDDVVPAGRWPTPVSFPSPRNAGRGCGRGARRNTVPPCHDLASNGRTPLPRLSLRSGLPSPRSGARDSYKNPERIYCFLYLAVFTFCILHFALPCAASDQQNDPLMKAAAMDAGKMNAPEKGLYQDSIQSTKQTIARETLDVFYHDALDYYHEQRYDECLELLDKIYSIDPQYEDVASLRTTVRRLQTSRQQDSNAEGVHELMHKGAQALSAGQNALAISYWKQALALNPDYAPAKKKIQDVNHALAQHEFESGYLHYHHGDLEDALDSWSNAIALDPTYKQRGLLLLMSKVELAMRRDQTTRLASQAYDQYQQNDLEGSLKTYQELLEYEPRHEEARRMTTKIKYQLGQTAFKSGQQAFARGAYDEAITDWKQSMGYDNEVMRSKQLIDQANAKIKKQHAPRPKQHTPQPKPSATAVAASTTTVSSPAAATAPSQTDNPEEAMHHYSQVLVAIRAKDFHSSVDELQIAYQLDPSNDRIYMAQERAKQEWAAANAGRQETP